MSIRKVQCTNGHYYDGNKYELCPVCRAPEKKEEIAPQAAEHKSAAEEQGKGRTEEKGMFDFLHHKKKDEPINIPDDKTRGLGDIPQVRENVEPPAEVKIEKEKENEPAPKPVVPEVKKEEAPLLFKQVEEKVNTIDAKTTGRYTTEEVESVVGWLVVTKGVLQGASFELNDGKNSIGRMRTNTVALENELSVSREKHAYVVFDAKNNAFYVQSGETNKMTYLNDTPVLTPQQLNAYDKIQLGDCETIFIPLCGDKFSWDDYMK